MIRKAGDTDRQVMASLMMQLWPNHSQEEILGEIHEKIYSPQDEVFLAFVRGEPVGFAHCGMRHNYVEGTSSSPEGYLEGIFVKAQYRRRGIAEQLLRRCEDWAREKGCREFASDCELSNKESAVFHEKMGFTETNRIVCFTKKLKT